MTTRRQFLAGLSASFIAAPAIVRAGSLMPINSRLVPWPFMRPMPAAFIPEITLEHDFARDESFGVAYMRGNFGLGEYQTFALCLKSEMNHVITLDEGARLRRSMWQSLEAARAGREVEFQPRIAA